MQYSADDVAAASSLQFLTYLCVSTATFWTYYYAWSLHEEWTFLLRSRWNKVKCLYIITRNVPFVIITLDLYLYFTPDNHSEKCLMLINIYSSFGFISVVCSESIFVLRTYALWNNNKFVLVATVCTAITFVIASIDVAFTTIAASHVMTSAIPGITGCYRTSHGIQLSMPFLLLFVFELGLISLTLIRAMQNWRTVNGPLYTVLVKHNIFYYACGLFLAAVNVLMPMLFSQYAIHSVFENLQFYVLAILATRMHLHLWNVGQDLHIRGSDALMLALMSDAPLHFSDAPVLTPIPDAPTADQTV
ncbi:uncharacterized protein BJ212DRAFT_582311 [Suillus subaureus]|uniref:DUF6533 domain-containing protein n=1 Tax=Suillus subaureus TaxID=48587 RepID=A0A9P7JA96_9AGAM|nr:uncharacterized protein BJ212DRAFT_582311 [Suillus subaureus]KAG1810548.1 hypothetical protein BJ212DRAFT_582311 [Suillus subaureus]